MKKSVFEGSGLDKSIIEKFKVVIGDSLLSVVQYGVDGDSFLFVLDKIDILVLDKLKPFNKPNFLFLVKDCIVNGTDVFPLEFYNIKTSYVLVYGEDFFKRLVFDKEHVRRELEFEFRSKLIHLRQEYLNFKVKDFRNVIFSAVPVLYPLLKGMAFLKNIDLKNIKAGDSDLFEKVGFAFEEDLSVLKEIDDVRKNNGKFNDEDLIIQRLMILLKSLSDKIDVFV